MYLLILFVRGNDYFDQHRAELFVRQRRRHRHFTFRSGLPELGWIFQQLQLKHHVSGVCWRHLHKRCCQGTWNQFRQILGGPWTVCNSVRIPVFQFLQCPTVLRSEEPFTHRRTFAVPVCAFRNASLAKNFVFRPGKWSGLL